MNQSRGTTALLLVCFFFSSNNGFQQGNRPKQSAFASPLASTRRNKPTEGARDVLDIDPFKAAMTFIDGDDVEQCSLGDDHLEDVECNSEKLCIEPFAVKVETAYDIDAFIIEGNVKAIPTEISQNPAENLVKEAMRLYLHFLKTHTLLTKTLTSGLVGIIGDVMAQLFEQRISGNTKFPVDLRRIFGIFFDCVFLSAPLMHYAYDFLEYVVPVHGIYRDEMDEVQQDQYDTQKKKIRSLKRWAAAIFHVLSDIFLLGPFYVLFIMTSTSLFEGRTHTLQADLLSNFVPTFKTSVIASLGFMPFQVMAFRILPTHFRFLYINMQDIIWNAVVSFAAHKARH